jgi:two-component system LytT family response regulator
MFLKNQNMKQLRTLLVDDEPKASEGLTQLIRLYSTELEVVGAAASLTDALRQIIALKPDLVFLDIEMPEGNGFDLVEAIKEQRADLVFVTAHADYALRAFKTDAIDYLLKPVSPRELRMTIDRILARREKMHEVKTDYKIRIGASEGIQFISCANVVGVEGNGRYSVIHTNDGKTQLVTKNIGAFEEELMPYNFFRVHKSWLVNCRHVIRLENTDGGTVELSNGKKVLLSRRKRNDFLKQMGR